jgi:uncharacterized protein YndB with AHSA1/START domain
MLRQTSAMTIIIQLKIAATPEKIFQALTTEQGLAGWITPKAKTQASVGAVTELTFDSGNTLGFRIEALERPGRVVWAPAQAPIEWLESRLTFAATAAGSESALTFTHSGLPEGYPAYGFFTYCWGQYIRSLKLFLETGTGEPDFSTASRAWKPRG